MVNFLIYDNDKKSRPKQALVFDPELAVYVLCSNSLFSKDCLTIYQRPETNQKNIGPNVWVKHMGRVSKTNEL